MSSSLVFIIFKIKYFIHFKNRNFNFKSLSLVDFPLEYTVVIATRTQKVLIIVAPSYIGDMRRVSNTQDELTSFLNAWVSKEFNLAEIISSSQHIIIIRWLITVRKG